MAGRPVTAVPDRPDPSLNATPLPVDEASIFDPWGYTSMPVHTHPLCGLLPIPSTGRFYPHRHPDLLVGFPGVYPR
jgi:hypothetical protein